MNSQEKYQTWASTLDSKVKCKVKISDRITKWQDDRQDKNNMPLKMLLKNHNPRELYWVLYIYKVKKSGKVLIV